MQQSAMETGSENKSWQTWSMWQMKPHEICYEHRADTAVCKSLGTHGKITYLADFLSEKK